MKEIAIKGHLTQGKKVIEILEMLGGTNSKRLNGTDCNSYYTTENNGTISGFVESYLRERNDHTLYTIEEFLEKFPYKVGDKVNLEYYPCTIRTMEWDGSKEEVLYTVKGDDFCKWVYVEDLQPYKEEIMEETIIDTVKESKGRYRIVLNPQFDMEVDEGEYYAVRRKPIYPKTYKGCCEVLHINIHHGLCITTHRDYDYISPQEEKLYDKIASLYKLIICRDAYWKIYGGSMGLGKPWKPADSKNHVYYFFYCVSNDKIKLSAGNLYSNEVFAFPTQEMRDTFKENFDKDLEICKELL